VDASSGLVARFDTGAGAAAVFVFPRRRTLRVEIQAFASAAGVIVAHSGGRSSGGLNHFALDGGHLAA